MSMSVKDYHFLNKLIEPQTIIYERLVKKKTNNVIF